MCKVVKLLHDDDHKNITLKFSRIHLISIQHTKIINLNY